MSEDVTIRAARAQQLLEDEVLQNVLTGMVEDAWAEANRADLSNPTSCVAAIGVIQSIDDFKSKLQSLVTSGKAAERKPFKVA
jgi:hypothetical protein